LLVYGGVFNELVSWFNCNNCSTRDAMRSLRSREVKRRTT
jgi:hypothetical protein